MKNMFLLLFLGMISFCFSQDIPAMEEELNILNKKIDQQQLEIDSLQHVIQSLLDEINQLKTKKPADKDVIQKKMAQILSKTKEKNQLEILSSDQKNQLEEKKRALDREYIRIINSLKEKKQSENIPGNQAEIEKQILEYTTKRLWVAPKFTTLHIDPALLEKIQFKEGQDSLEFQIYMDYLMNAYSQVNQQLEKIKTIRQDLEEIALLQEKTENFVSEIEAESNFGFFTQSAPIRDKRAEPTIDETFGGENVYTHLQQELQPIFFHLDQVGGESNLTQKQSYASPLDSTSLILNQQQYFELLKKAEEVLENYQFIIEKKLPKF
jgi:hypothetical protein